MASTSPRQVVTIEEHRPGCFIPEADFPNHADWYSLGRPESVPYSNDVKYVPDNQHPALLADPAHRAASTNLGGRYRAQQNFYFGTHVETLYITVKISV